VRGRVRGASPDVGNRCICYCNDCQAFGHFIGAGDVLDAQGGTDIYQISPARVEIEQGQDKIACLHSREGEPLPTTQLARLGMLWRIGSMILGGRLRGEHKQHPFFKAGTAEPSTPPRVLTAEQLDEIVAARDA
jgi:hypothetical protein